MNRRLWSGDSRAAFHSGIQTTVLENRQGQERADDARSSAALCSFSQHVVPVAPRFRVIYLSGYIACAAARFPPRGAGGGFPSAEGSRKACRATARVTAGRDLAQNCAIARDKVTPEAVTAGFLVRMRPVPRRETALPRLRLRKSRRNSREKGFGKAKGLQVSLASPLNVA